MSRKVVATEAAPRAIGPYSQAIVSQPGASARTVYCSGQIPLDPATGELLGAGDVKAQTHRILQNLSAVLQAAGGSLADVVKTTIFLTDLQDFALVNEVYGSYFPQSPPARATVQVSALPRGAQVEIEAIAVVIAVLA
jgi:2-iminobutanoate/2-iminopropanoate deaminase